VAEDLFKRLDRMRIAASPFAGTLTPEEARQARYVRPELVAEVEFRAWTTDGHLRHASFRGLREDKAAIEIVREIPKSKATTPKPQRRTVTLSHPDRVYWPDEGITKEGLADYYTEVWRYIAPYIAGLWHCCAARAASPVRCFSRNTPGRASTSISCWSTTQRTRTTNR
jgi:bifunctional non-homologous end joining protein LigD